MRPPSVKAIGYGAFWDFGALEEAEQAKGLMHVGANAFSCRA